MAIDVVHEQLVEALIRQNDPAVKISVSKIVLQLQSFLRVRFDEKDIQRIRKRIRKMIENYKKEYDTYLRDYSTSRKSLHQLHEILNGVKLNRRKWHDDLYFCNVEPDANRDDTEEHIENNKKVSYEKDSSYNALKAESGNQIEEIPDFNIFGNIQRSNDIKLCMLSHELKLTQFKVDTEIWKQRKKLNSKRRQACRRYDTFEDSILKQRGQPLYIWTEKMQQFLNLKAPLAIHETVYLVFKYIKRHKLLKDGVFRPDERLSFLRNLSIIDSAEVQERPQKDTLITITNYIMSHIASRAGEQRKDGKRYNNSGAEIPFSVYNVVELSVPK